MATQVTQSSLFLLGSGKQPVESLVGTLLLGRGLCVAGHTLCPMGPICLRGLRSHSKPLSGLTLLHSGVQPETQEPRAVKTPDESTWSHG